jgi:imidazole glycerol-phosphate synthase subunit HisF
MNVRIIPRLDIKGPNLVKGVHMEGLRVLGKPEAFAKYYYEHGADELIYMDAVASLYGRNSLLDIVERTSKEIFVPLTVGGGLRTLEDIRAVLRAGADKVSLNTAAIARPELISEAARAFGSSTIQISIDAIRSPNGAYEANVDYGREQTGIDVIEWAKRAESLGAGEVVITSIDREGTGKGFDLELTRRISESVLIPVIASGGAGGQQHVVDVVRQGRANGVSLASILHYNLIRHQPHDREAFVTGNTVFLDRGEAFGHIQDTTLEGIKASLLDAAIDCRHKDVHT